MPVAQIKWSAIKRALKKCADGYTSNVMTHHRWVAYNGKTWRTFPKGPGADPDDYQVQEFQVRHMATHLELDFACLRKYLPSLRPAKSATSAGH